MISFRCITVVLLVSIGWISTVVVDAFTITTQQHIVAPTTTTTAAVPSVSYHQPLQNGIQSFMDESSSLSSSSTMTLSLQERKIPTKEEIAQKKLTFNVIFWGGGFVAPFIATVFYFGFKFWEK